MPSAPVSAPRWPRLIILALITAALCAAFSALGLWQVERLAWKRDLIARVTERVDAAPVAAPGPADWPGITAETAEYRRVTLTGQFLNDQEVQIYTPSDFGPAYWVLTPLLQGDGTVVMINRGLVTEDYRDPASRPAPQGVQTVTGLLRISEDKGWLFARENRPDEGLWYRRAIGSITAAKGLSPAAPYFVDQELTAPDSWPRGGQTVLKFRNSHLSYALTWFGLALLTLVCAALVLRHELRPERDSGASDAR